MNISIQKLLDKIEEELQLAKKSPKEESLREKVYSIKTLCELILDEKQLVKPAVATEPVYQPVMVQPTFQQPVSSLNQPKKIEMEDGANGDSLFDF